MNLGNVDRGLEVGGLFVTFEGLAVALEPIVDGSFTDIGIGQGIVERDGVVIAGESIVQAAELFEGCSFFYVGLGMVSVEGENFLEADEGVAGLFQIEQVFSSFQQGREALGDSAGGRRRHNRSHATLDVSLGPANVEKHGQYADAQKQSDDDGDSELSDQKMDGLRVLLLRVLDGAQCGLLLGLNLADHLEGEVRHARFIITAGRGNGFEGVCGSCCGSGREKRDNRAGKQARAALDPAIVARGHEGLPK